MNRADFLAFIAAPRVAASFWHLPAAAAVAAWRADGLEIAEIRADLANTVDVAELQNIIAVYESLPTILTIRTAAEGGQWRGDEEMRRDLFLHLLSRVAAVDVELSATICASVVAAAKAEERACIVSRHNFVGADSLEDIRAAAENAFAAGADIFKNACMIHNEEDLAVLGDFLQQELRPCIIIGMGDSIFARRARLELPGLGSRIAFAAVGERSAPGQLSLAETAAATRRFPPGTIPA